MIQLCEYIPTVNSIERMGEVRSVLIEISEIVSIMVTMTADDVLQKASVELFDLMTKCERIILKASKSRMFSNAVFKKRIKDMIIALQAQLQKLVCFFASSPCYRRKLTRMRVLLPFCRALSWRL